MNVSQCIVVPDLNHLKNKLTHHSSECQTSYSQHLRIHVQTKRLNLQFRRKRSNTEPPVGKEPVAYKILHMNRKREEWHKKCALRDGCPIQTIPILNFLFPPIPKPIPEHPTTLISKTTTRNKACQTHRAYNEYWPETHMDPTEYFITSHKRIQNIMHAILSSPQLIPMIKRLKLYRLIIAIIRTH